MPSAQQRLQRGGAISSPSGDGEARTPDLPRTWASAALLSAAEMARADGATIAAGTPGIDLMEKAGAAVAQTIFARWPKRAVSVLCGPGNNGGDGFVVARLLREAGWPVRLALLGEPARLRGDAAIAAERWGDPVEPMQVAALDGAGLVVDALFGAGLARPLDGLARSMVEAIDRCGAPCVAVDLPSGVSGDTGAVLGAAPTAALTVTFFRPKPGHLLLPGREHVGTLVVADIGIREQVLADLGPTVFHNGPALWREALPRVSASAHKFARGHALIVGGERMTGAARLAARGARRIGAGLTTVACPPERFSLYAADAPGLLVQPLGGALTLQHLLADERMSAVLVGPGAGLGAQTRQDVLAALDSGRPCVIDADGLSAFAGMERELFAAVRGPCLMTPHEGELRRIMPSAANEPSKLARARALAAASGAVVLLKGADTVIADPRGTALINDNAPPDLATAGAGDVLAGMALGLLAQGMAPFLAAAAAAWLHGAAAAAFGPGLIAEDLPEMLPGVLRTLRQKEDRSNRSPASRRRGE